MLAHYHGQIWNAAEPARAMGVSESTTRRYLDLLSDALMVRQLQPCPFLNWLEALPFSSDVARFGDALRRTGLSAPS
jgi:DNA-binding IclR family transcriptional regulator